MPKVPNYTHFILGAPIDNVPAGTTGQLKRLDSYHVTLVFDADDYPELVFDIHDTGPDVWTTTIKPYRPRKRFCMSRAALMATVAGSFLVGAAVLPQPDFAKEAAVLVTHYLGLAP